MNQSLNVNYETITVLDETLGEHCYYFEMINKYISLQG